MRTAPGRHSSKLHALFDDVVNFTVREPLGFSGTQVGDSRIQTSPDGRQATPVDSMAIRTLRQEELAPILQVLRRKFERIFLTSRAPWNCKIPDCSSNNSFEAVRLTRRAQSAPSQEGNTDEYSRYDEQDCQQEFFPHWSGTNFLRITSPGNRQTLLTSGSTRASCTAWEPCARKKAGAAWSARGARQHPLAPSRHPGRSCKLNQR